MEKLMELENGVREDDVKVDSDDEQCAEDTPQQETFTFRLLLCPRGKNPTQMSGTIVYATTAIICEYSWRAGSNRTSTIASMLLISSSPP